MESNDKRIFVSDRIDKLLSEDDFSFDIEFLKYIHEYLFKDVLDNNGKFRRTNIRKREYILNGDSVIYANCDRIYDYLSYDIDEEKRKDYSVMSNEDVIKNISKFASNIWQVHPFLDGNTRSVSIYIQKYLKMLGFDVTNEVFRDENVYYRFALVIANYYNKERGIKCNIKPLEKVYRRAIFDDDLVLTYDDVFLDEFFGNKKYARTRKR